MCISTKRNRVGLDPRLVSNLKERYHITPVTHPPNPLMKGRPLQPVGKGLGVCFKGMPFKTSENHWSPMLLALSQMISKK